MRPRGVPAEIFPIGIIGERVGSASMRPRGIPAEIMPRCVFGASASWMLQ